MSSAAEEPPPFAKYEHPATRANVVLLRSVTVPVNALGQKIHRSSSSMPVVLDAANSGPVVVVNLMTEAVNEPPLRAGPAPRSRMLFLPLSWVIAEAKTYGLAEA